MVNERVLQTFLTESEDLLREIESQLLKLETAPDDDEAINALFRAIHTLKGSSGMLGFTDIEQFLHWVESVMEKVRTGTLTFSSELADVLLQCYDHMGILVDSINLENTEEKIPEILKQEESIVLQLKVYLNEPGPAQTESEVPDSDPEKSNSEDLARSHWQIGIKFKENTFRFGFDPTSFIVHLNQMGEIVELKTDLDSFPRLNEMDPESCYLAVNLEYICDLEKKDIEEVFEFLGDDVELSILPSKPKIESYVKNLQKMAEEKPELNEPEHRLGQLLINSGAVTEKEVSSALKKQQTAADDQTENIKSPKLGELLVADQKLDESVLDCALEVQKPIKVKQEKVSKTIRIETDKLDQFIDLVGELVISSAGIAQHSEDLKHKGLMEVAAMNSRLVGEIRERIMELRMVPVEETFNRFHRVIREINKESGKQIKLEIEGGDAELDKTVIEKIFDPLVHLVRNAADHGIESPETRAEKGKAREGAILLKAYHDAGMVVMEIQDDGAGINRKTLMAKAIEKGIIEPDASLTDSEILNLIFAPGFSTAKEVTKLSGRGVGMDVVKNNIEALRGTVDIESIENEGTIVRISLPLTMAIIEGLLIGVGDAKYVVPLDMVVECIDLSEDAKRSTHQHINLRGKPLPFLWLKKLFEEQGSDSDEQSIVVVKIGNKTAGLVADYLFGEIQAVIKNLDEVYKNVTGISGATILGNGHVCLILDVKGLIELAESEYLNSQKGEKSEIEPMAVEVD